MPDTLGTKSIVFHYVIIVEYILKLVHDQLSKLMS